jgi:agmatine/peptidylarginine deiminase
MDDITTALKKHLKVHQILGIDIPPLPGDDTDGHIDTLARFVDEKTLLVQTHPHGPTNDTLLGQLAALTLELPFVESVKPRIVALPCPQSEAALPTNYANFIMINGAVLVPTYNLPTDDMARSVIKSALPDRDIIGVAARALVTQAGGPHCTSMHIPQANHARMRHDG